MEQGILNDFELKVFKMAVEMIEQHKAPLNEGKEKV